jgi:benzoyl-CoA 2,3-dioxygenase component A
MVAQAAQLVVQHLIDPGICIRCNTCEETCPIGAIEHDSRNYVVKFEVCNGCRACISPCPTGAIDSWRKVQRASPHTIEEQYLWDELPAQSLFVRSADEVGELPEEVARMSAAAGSAQGSAAVPPHSACQPAINLYTVAEPAIATVTGNYRLTPEQPDDICHIVLDFGTQSFPVLEGQSIGIIPPGKDTAGRPHFVRLYSVASPRDGERPNYNNLALTVRRVIKDRNGEQTYGICSNYLCDLQKGDKVRVVGPYGATFLMPNHSGASLIMVCTGTGSAPMRAMTERRRRRLPLQGGGENLLFFGARSPEQLPYFGPLKKLPSDFIDINLAFSRAADTPKRYVQDLIRERRDKVAGLLQDENCYLYVCGLKGMEQGVEEAFNDVCSSTGLDWFSLRLAMLQKGRLHIETY